jgi:hypothetical protein
MSSNSFDEKILAFKERIKETPEFCNELYRDATIRLMAFKYAYYILSDELVKDATYDAMEKSWHVMGRALGDLTEEDISPCVDFDPKHPLADEGIKLANKLLKRK